MFRIGQKIVCVNTDMVWGIPIGIKLGKVYTILNISSCKCGVQLMINTTSPSSKICGCSKNLPHNAFMSCRFKPVVDESISVEILNEQPELIN